MLDSYLDAVDQQRKEYTVYSHEPETDLQDRLATRNVSIAQKTLPPGGPPPFVTVREADETVGALSVRQLEQFLSPPAEDSFEGDTDFREPFELFDETLFWSLNRRQLLFASREIEDRALRVGRGTLRAQFQTARSFAPQQSLYRRLAADTELSIHLYGAPEWLPTELDDIDCHPDPDHQLTPFWCVAFDGGPDSTQACVLLAKEDDSGYRGFWSYDSDLVTAIEETLRAIE